MSWDIHRVRGDSGRYTQVHCDRQLKHICAQEASGEEQHFQVLNLTGNWVEPCDHVISQFLRLLFRVGGTLSM